MIRSRARLALTCLASRKVVHHSNANCNAGPGHTPPITFGDPGQDRAPGCPLGLRCGKYMPLPGDLMGRSGLPSFGRQFQVVRSFRSSDTKGIGQSSVMSGRSDTHGVGRMSGESSEIARIACQHDGPARLISQGDDDRVHRGGSTPRLDLGAQRGGCARQYFIHGPDVAGAQQTILVEVSPMVSREGLYEDDGWNEGWPLVPSPKLLEAGPALGQHHHAVRVENQCHADRLAVDGPKTWSAQALASARSLSLVGPCSDSSSPK